MNSQIIKKNTAKMRIISCREENVASEGYPKIANNLFFSAALNSRGILVQQFCVTITQEQYYTTNNFSCCSGRSELQLICSTCLHWYQLNDGLH